MMPSDDYYFKLIIQYPSGEISESPPTNKNLESVLDDVEHLVSIFIGGGYVTLLYADKNVKEGKTFSMDGGISLNNWENDIGGPWGSKSEFLKRINYTPAKTKKS